jgi:hypothetical protein
MAEVKNVKINVTSNIKNVSSDTKTLNKDLATSTKGAGNLSKETANIGGSAGGVGALSGSLGKLSPALGGATGAASGLLKVLWALVANPIGAIIAAVVLALTALYKAFASTKAGGEEIEQMMAGLGAVIDVIRDRVLKFGSAISKFFSGDFKGALQDAKGAISGFGAEVASEFRQAANAKRYLQEVTDAVRELSVSRAKLNRDLAKSKEIITDETASYADKKKAIDQVRKAEEKQTAQELANAKKKVNAIKLQNGLSDSNAEALDKQAAAEAELYSLQEKSSTDRRNIRKTEIRIEKEEEGRKKGIADEQKSRAKANADQAKARAKTNADAQKALDKEREDSLKKISDLERVYSDSLLEAQDLEILNITRKYEEQIKLAEKYGQSTIKLKEAEAAEKLKIDQKYEIEKAKIEAEANAKRIAVEDAQFKLSEELTYSEQEKEVAALVASYEAKFLIASDNAELEKQLKEKQKQEIDAINQKYADKEIADEEAKAKKKKEIQIQGVANGLSIISNLTELFAGKSQAQQKKAFKIQKAINIATAILDTYKAANVALASAPPPFNFIAMGAAITAGLVNVKKISETEFNGGGASSGGASGGANASVPQSTQQAPSFNVVGNSGINQLAQIQQQPTQAYVVSGAVTSAQSLDRNRIQNATIG